MHHRNDLVILFPDLHPDRISNHQMGTVFEELIRKFNEAADAGSSDAPELARAATRALDKAASKGVLHKNTAARKMSRLASRVKALNA